MDAPLFDPARHEPLRDDAWSEGAARTAIESIAADALRASHDGLWATHPLEDSRRDRGSTLYMGAAGVLWGLRYLARQGAIDADPRLDAWASALPARYAATPDTGAIVPSLFLGEAGVLTLALDVEWRARWADRLAEVIADNRHNPTREILWGAPGTMIAALFAHARSGEARFRELYLGDAEALCASWETGDGSAVWTQDLYGRTRRFLGAAHGFAGNVHALLRGAALMDAATRQAVLARAIDTLEATARSDGELVNWPALHGEDGCILQWCHGAPGMITAFAGAPAEPRLDGLLLRGGELVWRAGPLVKGPNLCHGTAGNGAAFNALFARTGDARWLERARRFAMHAIAQVQAARAQYGQGRYSLWTGDVGVAVYLWQCVTAQSGLLSLDL